MGQSDQRDHAEYSLPNYARVWPDSRVVDFFQENRRIHCLGMLSLWRPVNEAVKKLSRKVEIVADLSRLFPKKTEHPVEEKIEVLREQLQQLRIYYRGRIRPDDIVAFFPNLFFPLMNKGSQMIHQLIDDIGNRNPAPDNFYRNDEFKCMRGIHMDEGLLPIGSLAKVYITNSSQRKYAIQAITFKLAELYARQPAVCNQIISILPTVRSETLMIYAYILSHYKYNGRNVFSHYAFRQKIVNEVPVHFASLET